MSENFDLIDSYASGPDLLQQAVESLSESTWDLRPGPGKWSIREVVCHLADAEVVYADRMKRVLMEDHPTLFEFDPNLGISALHCKQRSLPDEVALVNAVRTQMLPILRSCSESDFERTGEHSQEGTMTLRILLERITNHVPHHVRFIEDKIRTLNA